MTRKIKGLGLAFVAIAAMSMAAASGAQATELHITTEEPQVVIHGEQKEGVENQHLFTTNAGVVKCTQATFEATSPKTTDDLSATGTYTGCQGFGQAATVDMNGCKYRLTGTDTTGKTYGSQTVGVDVTGCTTGKSIEITTGICRMTVPEQHHLQHIVFTNVIVGQQHHLTADITATGIKYQADGPLCPTMPTGQTLTNGTYNGKATFKANKILNPVQITHNGHQFTTHQRGEVRSIQVT